MGSKSFTLESSINFKTKEEYEAYYRKRENVRAFIEEARRKRYERLLSEITVATYHRTPRQIMPFAWRKDILCGDKNDKQKTKKNTALDAQKD